MEELESREETKITWNLSQYKITLIGSLMQRAAECRLRGDLFGWFECWQQISLVIDNRLTPPEKKELNRLEKNFYDKGYRVDPNNKWLEGSEYWNRQNKNYSSRRFNLYAGYYIKYVNSLLRNVGMDFKEKSVHDDDIE